VEFMHFCIFFHVTMKCLVSFSLNCIGHVLMLLGFTPLVHATGNGKLPAVRFLLDHGADLHQRHEKVTPLLAAIGRGMI
jgi:ankyrin repeat protein